MEAYKERNEFNLNGNITENVYSIRVSVFVISCPRSLSTEAHWCQ